VPIGYIVTELEMPQISQLCWMHRSVFGGGATPVSVSLCLRHRASVESETPKASRGEEWEGSILLPNRLEGLGECRKLPSGVRGKAPAEIEFYKKKSECQRSHMVARKPILH